MTSFDTNIAVYAANAASPWHEAARSFIQSLAGRKDVAVCELVLVELNLKLRNEKIFPRPLTAPQATAVCQAYRKNRRWTLIETAPVMEDVWPQAAKTGFPFRRIIDLRLAQTLLHHGVTEFATSNEKDFAGTGICQSMEPAASVKLVCHRAAISNRLQWQHVTWQSRAVKKRWLIPFPGGGMATKRIKIFFELAYLLATLKVLFLWTPMQQKLYTYWWRSLSGGLLPIQ